MNFAGEQSLAIDYPVGRNGMNCVRGIHRPANHAGAHRSAEVAGDGSIAGDPATGNQFHDLVYVFEEVICLFWGFFRAFGVLFHGYLRKENYTKGHY